MSTSSLLLSLAVSASCAQANLTCLSVSSFKVQVCDGDLVESRVSTLRISIGALYTCLLLFRF